MKRTATCLLALAVILLFSSSASAKAYHIDKAFILMRVNPDASVDVRENITFDF